MCPARTARPCWQGDETPPDQILERIGTVDGRESRNRLAATRDHDIGAPLGALEVLAQPIVKLAHPDLIPLAM